MRYRAPWATSVKWITGGVVALFVWIAFATPWGGAAVWALMLGLYAFGPTGYSFEGRSLLVHRRAWAPAHVPLSGLTGASISPDAMRWSLRTFGNGGVFGFTGWFYNSRLGRYRAWVTDPRRAVVLEFDDQTIVVSPRQPHLFVDELRARTGVEARAEAPEER